MYCKVEHLFTFSDIIKAFIVTILLCRAKNINKYSTIKTKMDNTSNV